MAKAGDKQLAPIFGAAESSLQFSYANDAATVARATEFSGRQQMNDTGWRTVEKSQKREEKRRGCRDESADDQNGSWMVLTSLLNEQPTGNGFRIAAVHCMAHNSWPNVYLFGPRMRWPQLARDGRFWFGRHGRLLTNIAAGRVMMVYYSRKMKWAHRLDDSRLVHCPSTEADPQPSISSVTLTSCHVSAEIEGLDWPLTDELIQKRISVWWRSRCVHRPSRRLWNGSCVNGPPSTVDDADQRAV